MTERIEALLETVKSKAHHSLRTDFAPDLSAQWAQQGLSPARRAAERLRLMLRAQRPVLLPGQELLCLRTVSELPPLFTATEWEEIRRTHFTFGTGAVCNICSDYSYTIKNGLAAQQQRIQNAMCAHAGDAKKTDYLQCALLVVEELEAFALRYAGFAQQQGQHAAAERLRRVPAFGAQTFAQALQAFRVLHFALWCAGNYHNTVGRLDQFLYPYFRADLDSGLLDESGALELLEEFFLTFNYDSDLYFGMQKGDNGQSIMLGGLDAQGNDCYNALSALCIRACEELALIDPKINLRVNSKTPQAALDLGARLAKKGLGFPQYSNDEIVIDGLIQHGYAKEDAYNYTVAACWEFIIPGKGMDIPNIKSFSFLKVLDNCLHRDLPRCTCFEEFLSCLALEFDRQRDAYIALIQNLYLEPSPMQSLLMDGCIEQATDISHGCVYNNYGFHGVGISDAADSLAVIKKLVFDEKSVTAQRLIAAVDANFEGYEDLLATVRHDVPKMGQDDDFVDTLAGTLMDLFAASLEARRNERGGIYRPGTGTALMYVKAVEEVGASACGRLKGEPIPANFSPQLGTRTKGPVSVLRSFSKQDLRRVINGGPLTLELYDGVFRSEESIQKVALLIRAYMDMGGQQLQINAVDCEKLRAAQRHPEQYKNLIVRVWGWSGYFVELDPEYQEQIIRRTQFTL